MIARTHLIWQVCRNRLDLVHELVSDSRIVRVHVIGEVSHMNNCIVEA